MHHGTERALGPATQRWAHATPPMRVPAALFARLSIGAARQIVLQQVAVDPDSAPVLLEDLLLLVLRLRVALEASPTGRVAPRGSPFATRGWSGGPALACTVRCCLVTRCSASSERHRSKDASARSTRRSAAHTCARSSCVCWSFISPEEPPTTKLRPASSMAQARRRAKSSA